MPGWDGLAEKSTVSFYSVSLILYSVVCGRLRFCRAEGRRGEGMLLIFHRMGQAASLAATRLESCLCGNVLFNISLGRCTLQHVPAYECLPRHQNNNRAPRPRIQRRPMDTAGNVQLVRVAPAQVTWTTTKSRRFHVCICSERLACGRSKQAQGTGSVYSRFAHSTNDAKLVKFAQGYCTRTTTWSDSAHTCTMRPVKPPETHAQTGPYCSAHESDWNPTA